MSEAKDPRDVTDGEDIETLGQALRVFFSRPGPRLIAKNAAVAWGVRAFLGPPVLSELAICAGVVAWWPFQEWLAHKYLLHLEPREIFGKKLDPLFSQKHRKHHVNPRDIDLTLLPMEVVRGAMPGNIAAWLLLAGVRRQAVTGIAAYATMALAYEWTHFIVHTGYKPKSEYAKKVRKNHRLHHYRNENYWLGFVAPLVDRVFGTDPDPRKVPASKTVRDLFGLEAREAGAREAEAGDADATQAS